MPTLLLRMCSWGVTMSATPPATAMSQSPLRMAEAARCTATSEEEQAVSTATAGPRRSRK